MGYLRKVVQDGFIEPQPRAQYLLQSQAWRSSFYLSNAFVKPGVYEPPLCKTTVAKESGHCRVREGFGRRKGQD